MDATNQAIGSLLRDVMDQLHARLLGSGFDQGQLTTVVGDDLPSAIAALLGDGYVVKGRVGVGTPADVPWVGVFLADQPASAKEGFYVVYLFAKDGSAVYLTIGAGTEGVAGGRSVVIKRAIDARRALGIRDGSSREIDLRSNNERPKRYEASTVCAVRYDSDEIAERDFDGDLLTMVETLQKLRASGVKWSDTEPLHLVFKWSADIEQDTISLHRDIAESTGSVWWGRFSKSTKPSIGAANLQQLQYQLEHGIETHAYLYRRGELWIADLVEIRTDPPPSDGHFPAYYGPDTCNLFSRLTNFRPLSAGWLADNVVLASQPEDSDRVAAALGNQTSPLFIYELWDARDDGVATVTDEPDIAGISLADVCAEIESRCYDSGLDYQSAEHSVLRPIVVSLATKRFALLTGLSGSGKTRLAIALGQWFGPDRLKVVPVRPDWTGPDALLGFENGLSELRDGQYAWSTPDALAFMLTAYRDPENPYMLVLDEMNLAHVEHYFADVLSGIESSQPVLPNVAQVDGSWRPQEPGKLAFPPNLFVVGTVNIDDTTHMFSPKVLDRANTIEFRVATDELVAGAGPPSDAEAGSPLMVRKFLQSATTFDDADWSGSSELADGLRDLHRLLASHDREFGHRTFFESLRFGALLADAGSWSTDQTLDLIVLQKVLPRFNGSIRQLSQPLNELASWCHGGPGIPVSTDFDPLGEHTASRLPRSSNKIERMTRRLRANHFVSFAE